MTIDTTWNVTADLIGSYTITSETDDDPPVVTETTFSDVVHRVHWTCIAFDGPHSEKMTGVEVLPMPVDMASFIDIAALKAMEEEPRRAAVLGWAEIIRPGFVAATEAAVTARLAARLSAPTTQSMDLF